MSLIRCEVCQTQIGERTPDGVVVRSECHKDILVRGVLEIICKNGHQNLVSSDISGDDTKLGVA